MNLEAIVFFGIISIILIILIIYIVSDAKNTKKSIEKEQEDLEKYKQYIDSVKVGDIFELNLVEKLRENPFYDESESVKYRCVITDIRENLKGEKWVKFTNCNNNTEHTKEIYEFTAKRKRLKHVE
jgi:hypothetical protein